MQENNESSLNWCYANTNPILHFCAKEGWINDPNGLVYFEGEYHMYYQHYPQGLVHGPMHWGHAVSRDLVHWEHLPIALEPDEKGQIFSGSALVDTRDTSKQFNGGKGLAAFFTYHKAEEELPQSQALAFSKDKGRTWSKYEGNPILNSPGIKDFRDPKVFWHEESQHFIMVLACYDRVKFYGSKDFYQWELLGDFTCSHEIAKGVWECPDLFQLNVQGEDKSYWVLKADIIFPKNSGKLCYGIYFIGRFDGRKFVRNQDSQEFYKVDYGADFYAAQTWSDTYDFENRKIWVAWMNNWKYAKKIPCGTWRGIMSIPREVTLVRGNSGQIKLIQKPVIGDLTNFQPLVEKKEISVSNEQPLIIELSNKAYFMECLFENAHQHGFTLEIQSGSDNGLVIGYRLEENKFFVDRTNAGVVDFDDTFGMVFEKELEASSFKSIQILVDICSVEVFVNGGEYVFSNLYFPVNEAQTLKLYSQEREIKINNFRLIDVK